MTEDQFEELLKAWIAEKYRAQYPDLRTLDDRDSP